ncbi:MAG: Uncharacterized protein G01um10145_189 [Microgenomates group bacterium Gr01-1014_5]|nr:MAG: Uncharacterized protein G01um10145_189 [Microgenomates group bacterium Gr01-1014_5]
MNLTEIAFYARGTIKYTIIFVILLIVGRFAWNIGYSVYISYFPPSPPPPTIVWGKLPPLHFPEKPGLPAFSYTLQTATGELPKLTTTMPVYFMPKQQISFLKLEEAQELAANLRFPGTGTSLSETIYRFSREGTSLTLDINTVNKTLSVNYRLSDSPELLTLKLKSQEEAERDASSFLSSAGLLTEDLQKGNTSFEFLRVDGDQLVTASSLSEANFVRVNFFRQPVGETPVVAPNRKKANVWFLVTGSEDRDLRIIAGEYHYFPIDLAQSSTYPLKTTQIAWNELISGKAYIAQYGQDVTKITVRKIYLAYYDSGTAQGFLQPVIVFEGDGGFVAYVSAVTPDQHTTTSD